jgi:excisionase family DNA binding protein
MTKERDLKYTPQKRAHSINSAAEMIGAGRDGIYAAIRSGQLRARKFGRRTLILDQDLAVFLQSLPDLDLSTPFPREHGRTRHGARGEDIAGGTQRERDHSFRENRPSLDQKSASASR